MSTNIIIFLVLVFVALAVFIIGIRTLNRKKNKVPLNASHAEANDQIYVGNLPYRVDESDLRDYFSRFGAIETVKIVRNFRTGRSKGYAFVTYSHPDQASRALAAHGKDLQGRSMVVRIAKSKQQLAF